MNKRIQRIITAVCTVFLISLMISFNSNAFGDYNDYDYDSGSDWDSGGDYDYDDYYNDDDDDDYYAYSNDHSSHGSNGSSGTSEIGYGIFAVAIVIVFFALKTIYDKDQSRKYRQDKKNEVARQAALKDIYIPDRTKMIENAVMSVDSSFDVNSFMAFGTNVYMNMQKAWCNKDLTPLKDVLHKNLYERSEKQIQMKKEQGITQILENITVNEAYLTCYRRDTEYEYIRMYINSSMIDYQVEDSTGKIRFGDRSTVWTMRYDMTFMRSVGKGKDEIGTNKICPNCGAVLKGTSFDVCEFCGSSVTNDRFDWVVSDFNAIKDNFKDDGIVIS